MVKNRVSHFFKISPTESFANPLSKVLVGSKKPTKVMAMMKHLFHGGIAQQGRDELLSLLEKMVR